jgi:hypothetical protein
VSIARAWGIAVSADGTEMTLCVAAPTGSSMRANLESNGAVAETYSRPTTYRTVQLKGRVVAVHEPSVEQLAAADDHADAFSREASSWGCRRVPGDG